MVRPTLENGDIWDDALANASGFPQLDGADEFGSGPKVIDNWLSEAPGQIKANFYGWYNRIQVSAGAGRTLTWSGAEVVLGSGAIVAIAPGLMTVAANSSGFVVVSEVGTVISVGILPVICIPLAFWETDDTAVTSLVDLRHQRRDRVGLVKPGDISTYEIGDLKITARLTPSPGWLRCDGQRYPTSAYPLLFAQIGGTFKIDGDPLATFRVPTLLGRAPFGANEEHPLGRYGGEKDYQLTVDQLPTHSHGVVDPGHGHPVNDPGHSHAVNDPGHQHSMAPYRPYAEGNGNRGPGAELTAIAFPNVGPVSTQTSVTGLGLSAAASRVSVGGAATNIAIRPEGGGNKIPNLPPFVTLHYDIRAF
jgi:microcystin-dependent protein